MQGFKNILQAIKWYLQMKNGETSAGVQIRAYVLRERIDSTRVNRLDEYIMEPVLLFKRIDKALQERLTKRQIEILLGNDHHSLGLSSRVGMQNKQYDIRAKLEPWFIKYGIVAD